MKSVTLFLAAAGVAVAQNFSGQPACATACLSSAISAAGCAPTDIGCQCGPTKDVIGLSAAPCLIAKCTLGTELLDAQRAGEAQCTSYFATASLGSASASTTAASSGSTATSASSGSTITSGVSNTSSTKTDTEKTSTPATASSEGSQTSSPASASTGSTSSPAPASTGSTSSSSTGAAAVATPAAMGFGALLGVLGAVVAL